MSYTGIVPGGIPKSSLFSFGMIKVVSSEEVRIVEKKKDMSIVDSAGSSTKATRAAVIVIGGEISGRTGEPTRDSLSGEFGSLFHGQPGGLF
eukprot:scaffold31294_cov228-Skeletonema_menzelii.AAC.2